MRARTGFLVEFTVRPEVIGAMVYFTLFHLWATWMFCTMRYPLLGTTEPFRLIGTAQFAGLTVINIGFCVAFVLAGIQTRRSPSSVRKGHYAGLALGFTTVILVQVSANLAYGPIPLPRPQVSAIPRPQLLWSFDLSEDATERMTLEDLWSVGVKCRLWPADIPAGSDRSAVLERLLEAKYRFVGDHGDEEDLEDMGYSGD